MKPKTIVKSTGIIIALLCMLMLPVVVLAAFISVNTDDGIIDPDWASVTTFFTDPSNDALPDEYEIKQAWIARESDSSMYYFRVILYGQLPLDNISGIEARLDCNNNDIFTDAGDKIIVYYHSNPATNDDVIECSGDEYPACAGPNSEPLKGSDFGEEIAVGDGTYSYEWRADTTEVGGMDWSMCDGVIPAHFITTWPDLTPIDATDIRGFDVPTAVDLARFETRQTAASLAPAFLGLALVLVAAMLLALRARRQNP